MYSIMNSKYYLLAEMNGGIMAEQMTLLLDAKQPLCSFWAQELQEKSAHLSLMTLQLSTAFMLL